MTVFKENKEKSFRLCTPNEGQENMVQPLELCLWNEWDGQEEWDSDRYKSRQREKKKPRMNQHSFQDGVLLVLSKQAWPAWKIWAFYWTR